MTLISRVLGAFGRNARCACALIAAASFGLWACGAPEARAASSAASMAVSVGYGGYYVADGWVPVHVWVRNAGQAAMAKLVLRVGGPEFGDRRITGELAWPLWLPKDGIASTFIDVPGSAISQGAALNLVLGDRVVSTSWLGGNSVSHVDLVGVVSDSSQATQFLAGTSADGTPVLPVGLRAYDLPTSAQALADLSALVASVDELNALSKEQLEALRTWVDQGGLLIVTGTGLAPSELAPLPISPGAWRIRERRRPRELRGHECRPRSNRVDGWAGRGRRAALGRIERDSVPRE